MAIWERIDGTANMNINFSRAQFLETTEPYEYLYGMKNDPLRHASTLEILKFNALEEGVRNFGKLYDAYVKSKDSHCHPNKMNKFRQILRKYC